MLALRDVRHLGRILKEPIARVEEILDDVDRFYRRLRLRDPAGIKKPREVLDVRSELRRLQSRLQAFLTWKLQPTVYSHGGIRGRSIKTNAAAHVRSQFLFKTDIADFYPSIRFPRLYHLLVRELGCSPCVARLCTRICTYRGHLALGIPTSPILADQFLRKVDARIGRMCAKEGLVYTRFVDDITISGSFDLKRSGIEPLVTCILREHGFRVKKTKNVFGECNTVAITGVQVKRSRLDVKREYVEELCRQLADAKSLGQGGPFTGPFYTLQQILGRLHYVCWVNPRRTKGLHREFAAVDWREHRIEATLRGYREERLIFEEI